MAKKPIKYSPFFAATLVALAAFVFIMLATKQGNFTFPQKSYQIPYNTAFEGYKTNPPTSGPYYPEPTDCKIHDTEKPLQTLVNNLHRGHVVLFYRTSIDSTEWGKIRTLQKTLVEDGWFLAVPYDKIPSKIALASWGWNLSMNSVDETKIQQFYNAHKAKGVQNISCAETLNELLMKAQNK